MKILHMDLVNEVIPDIISKEIALYPDAEEVRLIEIDGKLMIPFSR